MLHQRSVLASRPSTGLLHGCGVRAFTTLTARPRISAAQVPLRRQYDTTTPRPKRCGVASAADTDAPAASEAGAPAVPQPPSWDELRQLEKDGVDVEVVVTELSNVGATVTFNSRRGFMFRNAFGDLLKDGDEVVGKTSIAKIIKVTEARNSFLVQANSSKTPAARDMLKVGQLVKGVVSDVKNYGAFVQLDGGVVGLLHITEISSKRVNAIKSLFQEGMEVKTLVIRTENGRTDLSTKELEATPGDMITNPQLVFAGAEEMAEKRSALKA